jgi:hypothetical protein
MKVWFVINGREAMAVVPIEQLQVQITVPAGNTLRFIDAMVSTVTP